MMGYRPYDGDDRTDIRKKMLTM